MRTEAEDTGDTRAFQVLPCPRTIQIETTARCNLRCKMCAAKGAGSSGASNTRRGDMPEPLYRKIIADLAQYRDHIETLSLFMDGEPLLDKRLPQWIRLAKDAGLRTINIATNGTLLRGQTAGALIESGLDSLIVSIDSTDPEVYGAIRIGADLKDVEQNVRDFMALRSAKGKALPHVAVRMIEMPENRGEHETFKAHWEGIVDQVRFQACHNWGSALSAAPEPDAKVPPCNWPFRYMVVYSDGRAGFCCLDYEGIYDLGNFRDRTLDEIWHGEGYAQLRDWMRGRLAEHLPKCRHCDFPGVSPFETRHWKTFLIHNHSSAPLDVWLEYEEAGETKRSGKRQAQAGRILRWRMLYEGQPGVSVCFNAGQSNARYVPYHPGQLFHEVSIP
ncbi:MAG: radical SAM protein [Nitrospiraceae bacterium]|nr:radical SAM protein [Nitrospiraceae bacterium]